jgi:predicted Fe-S protein YdhL (DUF1289 family)
MAKRDTASPCIGVCRFGGTDTCRGCLRTRAEIRGWKSMTDAQKATINRRVLPLIGGSATKKPKRGKLAKLDRKIRKLERKLEALRLERDAITEQRSMSAVIHGGKVE